MITTSVRQILSAKGADVWAVGPDDHVIEALRLMADKNVGAVLVLDGGEVKGILSERDYARKVILHGKTSQQTPVREIMTSRVVYVRPDQTTDECMALMTRMKIRHLPVMEEGRVVGVISIGDVIKTIVSDREFTIKQLENYITGR
jgi:CBS domain-containing protein